MKLSAAVVATAMVMLLLSTPIDGNNEEDLVEWLKDETGIENISEQATNIKISKKTDEIQFVEQTEGIMAGKRGNILLIYDIIKNPKVDYASRTNFLPSEPNTARVLLLDHNERGNLFFTTVLSGCDVWVATGGEGSEPLVLHINADGIEDRAENLRYKEYLACKALKVFNTERQDESGYKFIQRLSYDYARTVLAPNAINEYWANFEKNFNGYCSSDYQGIDVNLYPGDALHGFYGWYDSDSGEWIFKHRNLKQHQTHCAPSEKGKAKGDSFCVLM